MYTVEEIIEAQKQTFKNLENLENNPKFTRAKYYLMRLF